MAIFVTATAAKIRCLSWDHTAALSPSSSSSTSTSSKLSYLPSVQFPHRQLRRFRIGSKVFLSRSRPRILPLYVPLPFLWGYLISPIAGGTLVDYYGGKVVVAWGVALWSLSTLLTPWAAETSLWALLAMRVLLGMAEGVALPCMNNMIARWFPQIERSRAVGLAMAGFQLGSAVGLTLSPILMSQGGVFGPFIIFGLSGFLWVLLWLSATSSTPDRSRQISKYELEYIKSKRQKSFTAEDKLSTTKVIPPFRRLLSKPPTWSIIVANAMHSWVVHTHSLVHFTSQLLMF